jgi:hypothetical protein
LMGAVRQYVRQSAELSAATRAGGDQGRRKIAGLPMRRQTMCGSPARTSSP